MKHSIMAKNISARRKNNISNIVQQWGKHLYIVCLCVAALTASLDEGLLGPCLLDLQERTGVSFISASTYITAMGIGSVIGIAAFSFLHNRVNTFLVMAAIFAISSLCVLILSWCYTYTALFLAALVIGICRVLLFTYAVSEASSLKEGGRSTYLTAVLIMSMAGFVASSLVVAPYLSDQPFMESMKSTNETFGRRSDPHGVTSSASKLITPLAISASISFTPVPILFLMFAMSVVGRFELNYLPPETKQSFQLPMSYRVTSILLFSSLLAIGHGLFMGCRHFISAFATQQFHYTRAISAYLAGVFSFSGLLGRVFTAVVLPYQGHSSLIIFHSSLLVSSSGALYICSVHNLGLLEILAVFSCIGFTSFPIVSLLYVVVDENLFHVRGEVLSFVTFIEQIGTISNSLLKGILMQQYGFIQFIFVILVQAVLLFLLLFPFLCLVKIVQMKFRLSAIDDTH